MAITKEVLDELLKEYRGPDDLTGEEGLLKQLTKALVERAMGAELTEHLGYEKHEAGEKPHGNRRNGTSPKTVRSDQGPITLEVPRDREGTFQPKIVGKHQRELPGFSDKILSMYARGMTTREIGEHLKEIYGTEVSPQFITSGTDAVVESLEGWRNRELEAVWTFPDYVELSIIGAMPRSGLCGVQEARQRQMAPWPVFEAGNPFP